MGKYKTTTSFETYKKNGKVVLPQVGNVRDISFDNTSATETVRIKPQTQTGYKELLPGDPMFIIGGYDDAYKVDTFEIIFPSGAGSCNVYITVDTQDC